MRLRQGARGEHRDPALVFRRMAAADASAADAVLAACPPGTSAGIVRQLMGEGGMNVHREPADSGRICRSRYQFDVLHGCPHGCAYCSAGGVAVILTDVEEWIEREVAPIAREHPWQKVFMFNSHLSDTLCFEPEYGLVRALAEFYASTPDQCHLVHTKSANVDPLMDIDHRGRTILLWSLTSRSVSGGLEPGSATTSERIEAAGRCRRAGYPVRFKLKPIIPVRGWREECRGMVGELLGKVRPESIGLCTIAWMDATALRRIVDVSLLEPGFVKAMDDSAEAMRNILPGPFPHKVRAEIYSFYLEEIRRRDPDVPVYLCTESPAMWREFESRLGVDAAHYACGCGPQSPPGALRVESLRQPADVP